MSAPRSPRFALVNRDWLAEEEASVSIHDRCFRYGDGLFEAILVCHGKPFRAARHLARLREGARQLSMRLPLGDEEILARVLELIARNGLRNGVIRLQLSRGTGSRGYAPTGEEQPTIVITSHETPGLATPTNPGWRLATSSLRLAAGHSLARIKSCSRLLNVMATLEARERGADEALILDTAGHVMEGGSSNVFWFREETLYTPPAAASLLPGVTRSIVLELAASHGLRCAEGNAGTTELAAADEVFLTLTSRGVVPVISLDGQPISCASLTPLLQMEYSNLVQCECR